MGGPGDSVSYLYEPEGSQLHWDGLKPVEPSKGLQNASLSGSGSVHPADRSGMQGTSAAQAAAYAQSPPPERPQLNPHQAPLDHQTMMVLAREMLDRQATQHQSLLGAGPSTGDRDAAGGKIPEWLTTDMEKDR